MIMYVHVCSETLNITIFSGFIGVDLVTFHFWDCLGDGPVKVLFSHRKAMNAIPLHFVVLMERKHELIFEDSELEVKDFWCK